MTAPVELLAPAEANNRNDEWHQLRRAGITASEIAVVLGISPYDSPFSLYWAKLNDWRWDGNDLTSTGAFLERSIAEWWALERDVVVNRAGLYAHPDRPWQLATPDGLVHDACPTCADGSQLREPYGCSDCLNTGLGSPMWTLLECKWVAYSWDGWGEPGTDEIPVYYRAQCLWQLDVLGVDEVHVAALGPGGFRAYVVRRDEDDLKVMRLRGARFMAQLNGELDPPDLDSHSATLTTLKQLHPSVGEGDVDVPVELAETYRRARALKKRADDLIDRCEARIRDALGSEYNRAVVGKKLVASRSVYDQSGDTAELTALEDDWPVVDRLNPGRATSYAS